jgi:hypothetical protein
MERRTVGIIASTIVVFVSVIFLWAFSGERTASANLTEITDQSALRSTVQVSRVGIATGENYFGHKVRQISGTLKNLSDKPVRMVELKMVFMDYEGKSVQENVEKGYEVTQKPLQPGADYRFEINFENLPKTWNHRIPQIQVVKVAY